MRSVLLTNYYFGEMDMLFLNLQEKFMRGALLWLIVVPIPVIILLYLFHVI